MEALWPESNAGDVYAPGVQLRSTYVDGWDDPDPCGGGPFKGWAQWSGTSFAAPVVAATIAQAVAGATVASDARDIAAGWLTGQPTMPWPKKPGATRNSRIFRPERDLTVW